MEQQLELVQEIETKTDYDVLDHSGFTIDVINRSGSDGDVRTLNIYGESTDTIIRKIKSL